MTLAVFPTLDGIEPNTTKRAEFKTHVFEALSGRETRIRFRQYPKYVFKMSFEYLLATQDEAQLQSLFGFMLQRGGMYEAFYYSDPNDNSVVEKSLGAGDGVKTDFQLKRTYGGYTENVEFLNGAPLITLDEVEQTAGYTLSDTGLVSFAAAPASGAAVSWSGGYYYKVRFLADGYDFERFMADLHECKDIEFTGSVRNLV
jgi:uncharacterized protein (TIGR02217 family)